MRNFKADFMLDPDVIFLNHGSFGATPRPVFAEYQRWQAELERQPVEFLGRRYCDLMQDARLKLAAYLHVGSDNLVYITNATVGINIVARSLDLRPGDEVLASDHEYGAADRTWRFLAEKRGFSYINQEIGLPIESSEQVVDRLQSGVTPHTRVIFISHYTSPTALVFPVAEICRLARQLGILTVIDGAHAPGQIELNLSELGADFYIGNLHKWLCAPKGAAFLYARPEVQTLIQPLIASWGWQSEQPGLSRFIDYLEWSGTRDPAAFLAVPAAIQYQIDHNWDEIRSECHELAAEVHRRISTITRLPELYPDSPEWYIQMGALQLPDGIDAERLKAALYNDYKIEIPVIRWKNLNLLRFSLQAYNTQTDIIALEQALVHLLVRE
jgi:isopenicillin-N epimerase